MVIRIRVIIGSERNSTIYEAYWMVKLILWTKGFCCSPVNLILPFFALSSVECPSSD